MDNSHTSNGFYEIHIKTPFGTIRLDNHPIFNKKLLMLKLADVEKEYSMLLTRSGDIVIIGNTTYRLKYFDTKYMVLVPDLGTYLAYNTYTGGYKERMIK